ncbi:MAG: hypothetical protein JJT94_13365 [Bernardetiaceae bacterium]|nr:hypothetical protein [Bernardetiaceae bacterium]
MKKICILFCFFISTCFLAQAQQETEDLKMTQNIFKISPQHFIFSTLQFGFERISEDRKNAFQVWAAPTFNRSNLNGDAVLGGGLELQYRRYTPQIKVKKTENGNIIQQGAYLSAYTRLEYFDIEETDFIWIDNPVTGGRMQEVVRKEEITNLGFGFLLGYQFSLWENVMFDMYAGGGLRINGGASRSNNFDDGIFSRRYEGILPRIGFSIGIGL